MTRFLVFLVLCMLAASAARAGTCPPRATLDALAKETWDGATAQPKCTAIRGSEPLTFVVDIATFEGKRPPRDFDPILHGGVGYAAIIDGNRTVRWRQRSDTETPGNWYDWQVVDLDGDGRDELIAHRRHSGHMSSSLEELLVFTIDHGEPTEATTLPVADHVPAKGFQQNSCTSTYRLVRDGRRTVIEVVGKRGNDPELTPVNDLSCPKDGKHVYRWTGKELVDKPGPRARTGGDP